jgi:hypothetical protein
MLLANKFVFYSFAAIAVYLLLVNWRGANALLGTAFSGYGNLVKRFQGR